jgi:hypothetical protein
LAKLKEQRVVKFDDSLNYSKQSLSGGVDATGVDALFWPTLNFLFILGLLEYRQETDEFEYTGL